MSKEGRMPTEKEVREYFQRSYYVDNTPNEEGGSTIGTNYLGPAYPTWAKEDRDD